MCITAGLLQYYTGGVSQFVMVYDTTVTSALTFKAQIKLLINFLFPKKPVTHVSGLAPCYMLCFYLYCHF